MSRRTYRRSHRNNMRQKVAQLCSEGWYGHKDPINLLVARSCRDYGLYDIKVDLIEATKKQAKVKIKDKTWRNKHTTKLASQILAIGVEGVSVSDEKVITITF